MSESVVYKKLAKRYDAELHNVGVRPFSSVAFILKYVPIRRSSSHRQIKFPLVRVPRFYGTL